MALRVVRVLSCLLIACSLSPAQFKESVERSANLLHRLEGCLEGYASSISGTTINYSRMRPDRPVGLLVRASTDALSIEWRTQKVPPSAHGKEVTFVIMAGIGTYEGPRKEFQFAVNGIPRFSFSTIADESWAVRGLNGGALEFDRVLKDVYEDVFGYLRITVPSGWIAENEPVRMSVTSEKDSLKGWFIAYQDSNVISFLRDKVANDAYCDIRIDAHDALKHVTVTAPSHWSGKQFQCNAGAKPVYSGTLIPGPGHATAAFTIDAQKVGPTKFFVDGELIADLTGFTTDTTETRFYSRRLVTLKGRNLGGGSWLWEYQSNRTEAGSSLLELAQTSGGEGVQHFIISTHQDIAWMDSPEQCVKDRDEKIITPALAIMKENPAYTFGLEDVLCLREFLERHPDRKSEIGGLMHAGRLTIGASYTQPYEELSSGEMLVRQFYAGRRWLKKTFPGCDTRTYWNVDVPGRTLQMPQILSKAGVEYLVMSRFEKGLYRWLSPDGSGVVAYSPSHYGDFSGLALGKEFQEMADYMASAGRDWNRLIQKGGKNIPVLCMSDMSTPVLFDDFMEKWNSIKSIAGAGKPARMVSLPPLRYSTAEQFFDAAVREKPLLPVVQGERPDIWLYIHGPTHHWAISAKREADYLLPAAETFSAIDGLLSKTFAHYPQAQLTDAWESQIYPDHGWGGKNGEITDSTFRAKYEHAREIGERVVAEASQAIACRVRTVKIKGIPVTVFNSLSWQRSAPVRFTASFKPGTMKKGLVLRDAAGRGVPNEIESFERYPDGTLKSAEIVFIADSIPSIGYKTFYLAPTQKSLEQAKPEPREAGVMENAFYKITLGNGGLRQVHDKELGKDLLKTGKFLGGELFTMQSVGEDAGEWGEPQYPTMEGFERASTYKPEWHIVESGAVRQVAEFRQALSHTTVVQRVILYKSLKQIDLETSLLGWDGTKYREFRLAFPLDMSGGRVVYEVPFGTVKIGTDEMKGSPGERYKQPASEIHPRSIQNWIGMSDDTVGVTISSSVAVWDDIDPTDRSARSTLLQPILLASRRSCNGAGNWYLQIGDHDYRFSFTSHQGGWDNGKQFGAGANVPLIVVFNPVKRTAPTLPEKQSFLSIDEHNVVLSTVKKAEDDDAIVLRLFEDEGRNALAHVRYAVPIQKAAATNIIEEEETPIPLEKDRLVFDLGSYAIRTFKLKP